MTSKPWHQLCHIRDDVSTGKLTLAESAADLNDVRTGTAPVVYRDPKMGVFALRPRKVYSSRF